MWWQWLIFGLIILMVPVGLYAIKNFVAKRIKPTEEQNKIANQRFAILCLFYWLCDCFYMTFIINNLTWKFILGGLIMVIIFYNLTKAFINGASQLKFGLIQDFIVGVALTIYLIYIIPNENLQQIVIPIVSAVYGGLLTLVGVAWTIRKSDKDRKEEEIKKAKPLIFISSLETTSVDNKTLIKKVLLSKQNKGTLKKSDNDSPCYNLHYILINNSDYSHVAIRGFVINKDYHLYDFGQVLPKNTTILLINDYKFKFKGKISYVAILIQDMMDNLYELELNFNLERSKYTSITTIKVNSGIELRSTSLQINPKEI